MAEVQQLQINSRHGAYDVTIANGALASLAGLPMLRGRHVVLVTSAPVLALWGAALLKSFGVNAPVVVLHPDGERAKSVRGYASLLSDLARAGAKRDSVVLAVGGGVTGDLAGFAAATYMRGLGYIQVPTTLLAQVDSSIGGKTGIDLPEGKNLAGSFHPPLAVMTDPLVPGTLPSREFRSGLYECVKSAILGDAGLFRLLQERREKILRREPETLAELIYRTAAVKARIVNADEYETGERALLNFGHTFGHGLEAALRYRRLKHGEAVAWGMLAAIQLSERLAGLSAPDAKAMRGLVLSFGLLPRVSVSEDEVASAMAMDKKHTARAQRFVLTRGIGSAHVAEVDAAEARVALRDMLREAAR